MTKHQNLTGKVSLVTGGSRGIGRSIALALAQAGSDVVINYHSREHEAHDVRNRIESYGRRCIAVQADVSIQADVIHMIESIRRNLGIVSILINNAGISVPQKIEEIDEVSWDRVLNINLKSMFLVTQTVIPEMRSQGWGRIVNISSTAAQVGGIVGPHYAASKAGVIGLSHYYAQALAKDGITVNAVAPALIETDMLAGLSQARPDLIPLGRFGTVNEVSDTVIMIVQNGFITGQTINVNGGRYMS